MCKYCDYEFNDCEIFQDPLDNTWYLYYETGELDDYDGNPVYDKIHINYCPWCGRDLENKVDFLKDRTPVLRFTTEYRLESVCNIAKSLLKKYPNLVSLPQDFDVDWMDKEIFERWVEFTRKKLDKNNGIESEE